MSTDTQTYEYKNKQYRKTGEVRFPRAGEVAAGWADEPFRARHDFYIMEWPILEEVKEESIDRALVQFVGTDDGVLTTVQTDFPTSAQRAAADAVEKGWDLISSKIDEVDVIVVASIPRGRFAWAIHRGSPCWNRIIQPKIDALRKAAKPALLDDPRYIAALEHVNNVLAKFDKPPVDRLQPSLRQGSPHRACNCPISVTINKALGFEPITGGDYYNPYKGVTAYTTSGGTEVVAPSNGDYAELHGVEAELHEFVVWADNNGRSADEEIAEALEYSDE